MPWSQMPGPTVDITYLLENRSLTRTGKTVLYSSAGVRGKKTVKVKVQMAICTIKKKIQGKQNKVIFALGE